MLCNNNNNNNDEQNFTNIKKINILNKNYKKNNKN